MKQTKASLLVLVVILTILYMGLSRGDFSPFLFDLGMGTVLLALAVFFVHSQRSSLRGVWLKPSNFFVLAFLAVNFQYMADVRLGLKSMEYRWILYPDLLNHCLALGVIGFLAFVAGYIWKPIPDLVANRVEGQQSEAPVSPATFRLVTILQVLLFFVFILTIDVGSFLSGAVFSSEEGASFLAANSESLLYVTNALVIMFVAMSSAKDGSFKAFFSNFPKVSLAIIGLYMVLRLFSGDRGPVIYTAFLLLYGFLFSTRKKIRLWVVLVLMLAAMLLMSLVGMVRNMDISQSFGQRMSSAFSTFSEGGRFDNDEDERTVFRFTEELGFSCVVNQIDVEAIKSETAKLDHGKHLFYEVLNGIPFLPGIIQNSFHVRPEQFSSSGFANYHFFSGYERTWGIGTTIIGDFYISFGALGVLLGLFLAGLLFRYLDVSLFVSNRSMIKPFPLLFVLLFASKAVYMPRSIILCEWPRFIWGVILLLIIRAITGDRRIV